MTSSQFPDKFGRSHSLRNYMEFNRLLEEFLQLLYVRVIDICFLKFGKSRKKNGKINRVRAYLQREKIKLSRTFRFFSPHFGNVSRLDCFEVRKNSYLAMLNREKNVRWIQYIIENCFFRQFWWEKKKWEKYTRFD